MLLGRVGGWGRWRILGGEICVMRSFGGRVEEGGEVVERRRKERRRQTRADRSIHSCSTIVWETGDGNQQELPASLR